MSKWAEKHVIENNVFDIQIISTIITNTKDMNSIKITDFKHWDYMYIDFKKKSTFINIMVSGILIPFNLVDGCQHAGGIHCFHYVPWRYEEQVPVKCW